MTFRAELPDNMEMFDASDEVYDYILCASVP